MWLRMLVSQAVKQAAEDQVRKLLTGPTNDQNVAAEARQLDAAALKSDALLVFGSQAEAAGWIDAQQQANVWPTEHGTLIKAEQDSVSTLAWINHSSTSCDFLDELVAWCEPRLVILAGFAVGLAPEVRRGSIVIGQQVTKEHKEEGAGSIEAIVLRSPLEFGESQESDSLRMGKLISLAAPPVAGAPRKALFESCEALAADPDAFGYAQVANRLQHPWIAVRIVTEAWDHEASVQLKSLLDQATLTGKIGVAVGSLINEPKSASELWRIHEDALKASDRLAKFLKSFMAHLV